MKLSCIDQSVSDGDCYILMVADVSESYFKFITNVLYFTESHALRVASAAEQPTAVLARLLRLR